MTKRILNLLTALVMAVSLAGVLPAVTATADYWGVWQYNILNDGTVEIIGFSDDSVTSLDIPATLNGYTVTSIGGSYGWNQWSWHSGFENCEKLTNITIPDSVTSIGDLAFFNCYSLTSITIPNSVTSIGDYAFCQSGLLSVTIPDSVTYIGNHAFDGYYTWGELFSNLTSVKIGNGVTYIGESAFEECEKLTSVIMGNSLEIIDNKAFYDCESLKSITISDSVTSIGEGAFSSCERLSSIIIPENVTSIGGSAFKDCSGLTSVIMPKNITSIGESTFSGCTNKNLKIYLLGKITDIGSDAFSDVVGKVYVRDTSIIDALPSTLTPILLNDYGDCGNDAMWFFDSNGVMTILGSGSINNELGAPWRDYNEDITSVVIEKNITNIGDYAFYSCSNLSKITIPDSVTSIGNSAFKDCYALTSVTIPKSVTSIGNMAFGFTWDSIIQEDVKVSNFKIYCYKDTAGETYAKRNALEYELLDLPSVILPPAVKPTSPNNFTTNIFSTKSATFKSSNKKPTKVQGVYLKKGSKKKVKISWTKVSDAKGYQVKWATNKSFKKAKKKFTSKSTITIKKLNKNKYFVKVRAYKIVNGNKVYGKWSKVLKLVRI